MKLPPSLDRSTFLGDVTPDVRLYCDDCEGEAGMVAVVWSLEQALEAWAAHRSDVHQESAS